MPRIRSIKPEHKSHRKVGRLSDRSYRLWIGLITEADDAGRLIEDLPQLRALVFGFQDRLTVAKVRTSLEEIEKAGLICRYSVNGIHYIALPSWLDHQRINRPTPSRIPAPKLTEPSVSPHGTVTEPSRTTHSRSDLIRSDLIGKDRIGGEGSVRGGEPQPDGFSAKRSGSDDALPVALRYPATEAEERARRQALGQVT